MNPATPVHPLIERIPEQTRVTVYTAHGHSFVGIADTTQDLASLGMFAMFTATNGTHPHGPKYRRHIMQAADVVAFTIEE